MTTEAERSYRRRLLATALPPEVQDTTLQECLDVLDRDFGQADDVKYSDVIARMEKNLLQAEVNLNRLLGRILVLRRKNPNELLPDPAIDIVDNSQGLSAAPRLKVFNQLFDAVAKDAERRGKLTSLRSHLGQQAFTLGVGGDCVKSITGWANGTAAPAICGSDEDLHRVINCAFVWMCTDYGPVEADRVLLAAIRLAEGLPEAFDFSPRKFL